MSQGPKYLLRASGAKLFLSTSGTRIRNPVLQGKVILLHVRLESGTTALVIGA